MPTPPAPLAKSPVPTPRVDRSAWAAIQLQVALVVSPDTPCAGYCPICDTIHTLPSAGQKAIDDLLEHVKSTPALKDALLDTPGGGQMLGVLTGTDDAGRTRSLYALSSVPGGARTLPGFVPPVLSEEAYARIVVPGQARIKALSAALDAAAPQDKRRAELKRTRAQASRDLFSAMHTAYWLRGRSGQRALIKDVFIAPGGIPGGTGECCAPRLLHHAHTCGITPRGIAEVYVGQAPKRGRQPGHVYPCCETRCQPILGFLLCPHAWPAAHAAGALARP